MYAEAWRKRREHLPTEPLEDQIAAVIEQHPEYQPTFDDGEAAIERDYSPEDAQSNPFLHMGMHLAVREQVATDRPAGIRSIHGRLAIALGSQHEAEHRMIDCLGETLWNSQRSGTAPDERAYLEALQQLTRPKK
jgi:hypothetical protein